MKREAEGLSVEELQATSTTPSSSEAILLFGHLTILAATVGKWQSDYCRVGGLEGGRKRRCANHLILELE